ncbi:hypothetical protein M758_9G077000 [Ceratodon purpureus]|nr:hypothetical protein M758_9G077000 [Ceratodon purpureus]
MLAVLSLLLLTFLTINLRLSGKAYTFFPMKSVVIGNLDSGCKNSHHFWTGNLLW